MRWEDIFEDNFLEWSAGEEDTLPPRCWNKKQRPLCGARCRSGLPCKAMAVMDRSQRPVNGRCRMHGGLTTGAKTPEGRKRIADACRSGMIKYWAQRARSVTRFKTSGEHNAAKA